MTSDILTVLSQTQVVSPAPSQQENPQREGRPSNRSSTIGQYPPPLGPLGTTTHIPWRRDPSWMALGGVIPGAGSSPGHDAELAADGLGVLGGTEQLRGASLVQAVLGKDVPKLSNHHSIGNHLSGTGNKLLLALERDRNQWDWGEKGKNAFPAGQAGSARS